MVWPFKKRKELIDLTMLAKRGIIKIPQQEEEFKALQPSTQINPESDFSFLGSMASSASSASSDSEKAGISKNKIEDIEFRIESLSRRINSILDRLDLAEKKIGRNERKEG